MRYLRKCQIVIICSQKRQSHVVIRYKNTLTCFILVIGYIAAKRYCCRQASRWTFHDMKIIQKKNEVLITSKAKAAFQQLPRN